MKLYSQNLDFDVEQQTRNIMILKKHTYMHVGYVFIYRRDTI